MNSEKQTLDYYDQNADSFISGTQTADMRDTRERFTSCLPEDAFILDFGCGSGRDTKAFLDAGFQVDATDGSEILCQKASEYTGIVVRRMLFQELDAKNQYDGIWACASILHLPRHELMDVIGKIEQALKPNGILYASFKYGKSEGIRNGRYFTDFTEENLNKFWESFPTLWIFQVWITRDVRPDREEEQWINILAKRVS